MRKVLVSLVCFFTVQCGALPTYFCYTQEEVQSLCELCTEECMEKCTLIHWDEVGSEAVKKNKTDFHEGWSVFAYLYQAQADAAFLSYNVKGKFAGSFDPVSSQVLALFFPKVETVKGDEYSEKLAEIVVAKVKDRMAKAKNVKNDVRVPRKWRKEYSYGMGLCAWMPWYICHPSDYWPCPPPAEDSPEWKCQIEEIKRAQEPMTESKKEAADFWAGIEPAGAGDWRCLANNYIFTRPVPLSKTLRARAVLMTTLCDATLVCFTAKYHYMVMRPKKRDDSIHYEIPLPKHPSYPAGHSVEGGAAATVLCHFFPKECGKWNAWAEQSGWSRIWAGIHYPIDHTAGMQSGEKVANAVLKATSR